MSEINTTPQTPVPEVQPQTTLTSQQSPKPFILTPESLRDNTHKADPNAAPEVHIPATDIPQIAPPLNIGGIDVTVPKPANAGEMQDKRNPDGTFKKGMSGNPIGKAPGVKNFTTKVREALQHIADGQATTYETLIVKRIMLKAAQGDTNLIKHMWDHLDGRPPQTVENKHEGLIGIGEVSEERIDAMLQRLDEEMRIALTTPIDEQLPD